MKLNPDGSPYWVPELGPSETRRSLQYWLNTVFAENSHAGWHICAARRMVNAASDFDLYRCYRHDIWNRMIEELGYTVRCKGEYDA